MMGQIQSGILWITLKRYSRCNFKTALKIGKQLVKYKPIVLVITTIFLLLCNEPPKKELAFFS